MQTIRLSRPLKVNGKELKELPCDMEAVTVDGFTNAEARAKRKAEEFAAKVMEFDYSFHLYLGFEGVMAADPAIDIADLERLTGSDLTRVMQAGRFFINSTSDGDEPTEESE